VGGAGQAPSPRPPGGKSPRFDEARLKQEVQQRIQETREQRVKARQAITSGTPLKLEEDWERRTSYVERVKPENLPPGAEAIQGDPVDYVDAVFLLTGTSAARTVAHVLIDDGRTPYGSGFMISPKLFITTTSSIGVAFAVSLGLSHGVVSDPHHLRCSGALERDRPLSRNSAALLRLVASSPSPLPPLSRGQPKPALTGTAASLYLWKLVATRLANQSCIGIDAAITADGLVVSDIAGVWKRSRSI
jgi:hypothetical protein